jgi:hypothetical protein
VVGTSSASKGTEPAMLGRSGNWGKDAAARVKFPA